MQEARAILRKLPYATRKVRLVVDLIRNQEVSAALVQLAQQPKAAAEPIRTLLLSAVANWKQKNNQEQSESLFVTYAVANNARMIKRIKPAPQGRAHRIRKRSSHVTVGVNRKVEQPVKE